MYILFTNIIVIVTDETHEINHSSQVDCDDGIVLHGNQSTMHTTPASSHSGSTSQNVAGNSSSSSSSSGSSSQVTQVILDIASSASPPPYQPVGITFP